MTQHEPGPLSGAGIPSESFEVHARMRKALKLAGELITRGITLEDALHMGPSLRRMFEHDAAVHQASDVTWGVVFILLAEQLIPAPAEEESPPMPKLDALINEPSPFEPAT